MITSTMSEVPLSISRVLRHGARVFGGSECLTLTEDGFARTSFREIGANAARLAKALTRLGIGHGDPVGSLSWNTAAHLEAYFGIAGMGAVLHTGPRVARPSPARSWSRSRWSRASASCRAGG